MTLSFYDANAQVYFDSTVTADVSAIRHRFLSHLPPGAAILDAGCGSGRDTKAFREAGYEVTAFDGSPAMVALAREYTGGEVACLRFDEVEWVARFEGIWACASLLHVPRDQLALTFGRLAGALRTGGAWYFSMKLGTTTRHVEGRSFTDILPEQAEELGADAGLKLAELWISDSVQSHSSDRWVNVIARKP
jgi:SAM-dependent methyltransferase